jgi:phosphatidylserine/phosphatidylglycerophosphate/cardiolipin synthase-like enzyme
MLILLALGYLSYKGYIDLEDLEKLSEVPGVGEVLPGLAEPPIPEPREVSSGTLQTFFTTPWLVYPDVPEQRAAPPFEQAIIADIDAAQQSVELATFDYNLPSIAAALIRAHERGVTVRVALDRENLEKPEMSLWAGRLESAGIPISWEDSTAFQHSKFIIVDSTLVWTGSWNVSENGTYRNNNNLLRLTIPAIVDNYTTEFSQMADGFFGNDKAAITPNSFITADSILIENYFSPQDEAEEHIVERLRGAQSSIRFMAFSFTSDPIGEAMLNLHHAGVLVQGVFEKRNARGIGSELERLREGGIEVLEDGNCYTMHHKVIIIDDATVITGSYNFTRRARDTNDENLLILDDPTIARQFIEEYERVYEQARHPTQCGR